MSLTTAAPAFDICAPLPSGVTVLEASAGTGKTYTITALAARYVAEGTPLERLLLVTFTRMATGELRERVRERLVSVERDLGRFLAGQHVVMADPVVSMLALGSTADVRRRRERIARALADFDAATIATTHGFCQAVLGGLGIAGDLEPDVQFVEDLTDLRDEVVDDLYVRSFGRGDPGQQRFSRAQAGDIADLAIDNPDAPIAPAPGGLPGRRAGLARAVREELERRKHRMAVMTYDDLLTRLDAALDGPSGTLIGERLRARYDIVLVDEFQDTDPVQWRIMQRAFATGDRTLVVIADPKQAIYAFRGADVFAYLDAARSATLATLGCNRRSDQPLIDAYDALFDNARLGHEGIVYRRVQAAPANRTSRLRGTPVTAPLRIRVVRRDDPAIELTYNGFAKAPSARDYVAADLASDLVELLSSSGQIESRDEDGALIDMRTASPGDVAVLVRTNRNAALIRDALERAGIPAVINGAGSVFGAPPAGEWLRLLEALERPTAPGRARALALTSFIGWSAEQVARASEDEWAELHRRLHDWARVVRSDGVAALLQTVTTAEQLPRRVLSMADGERQITDLRHVGQLLHAAASEEQLGVAALTAWLRKRISEAGADTADEDRSRRLESDAEAVQVLTIHRSKGLEFPIVYAPFLWEPGWIRSDGPVVFHDPEHGDRRTLDVSLDGEDFERHSRQALVESRGEELRLAYVALTRARHQAVVWWAGSKDSRNSPLSRLVFARGEDGGVATDGSSTPKDAFAFERFSQMAAAAPGRISVEWAAPRPGAAWAKPPSAPMTLEAAAFDRPLDWSWRRTSYSDITAGAYGALVTSEAEEDPAPADHASDGPAPSAIASEGDDVAAAPSPLAAMGSGVRVGTLVHRVLQEADFTAADLEAELAARIEAARAWRHVELGDATAVASGLRLALETPLGPLLEGLRLCDLPGRDRLDELGFELPLVGGDEPTGRLTMATIATAMKAAGHDGDAFAAAYAERLADPALRSDVRGYLTGSLDLVLRLIGADGTPRFAVADYKTNRLAPPDAPLTLWHYRPEALQAEMLHSHYGLQALLYTVALHRYLRWRLPGYDPAVNLAGVLYLFLRGMTGADGPADDRTPYGVWSWRPSAELVVALSDTLDRGAEIAE